MPRQAGAVAVTGFPGPAPAPRPATSSSAAATASSPPSPGEFPTPSSSAPLLARISTDDQFQTGIQIFIAGLQRSRAER